ncbi:hypothetical protein JZO82_05630 [Vagococcus fluvialis]|uniref:hypothetical protein n=1 Tax=Vagococcus fluvialis TaxID=2738 RepID=UPI001A8C2253|nr:hypothetical protein [Vagococcus fluvialis]MBO0428640.1 hypothetical protein [Vagococcus fluvialis]
MEMISEINIAYIDDDVDVIYGPLKEIEDEITRMEINDLRLNVSFVEIRDELSEEKFWEKLLDNNYHGIILDYKLVDSKIFENANIMWKKIKLHNPLFPLAIYTSRVEEVTLNSNAESVFEKGNEEQTKKMVDYLLAQVKLNLDTVQSLKRVNEELKNDQGISYAVIKNEEKIENQFSLFYDSDFTEDDENQFKKLMGNAFDIIEKYKKGNGNP